VVYLFCLVGLFEGGSLVHSHIVQAVALVYRTVHEHLDEEEAKAAAAPVL